MKNTIIEGVISYTKVCNPLFSIILGDSRKTPNWASSQKTDQHGHQVYSTGGSVPDSAKGKNKTIIRIWQ